MNINWSKDQITKEEAIELLLHAHECLDYVSKAFVRPRPHFIWGDYLMTTAKMAALTVQWLKSGDKFNWPSA